jgi:hypothetical protein
MCALGLDLNVGAPRVFTSGGVPSPDGVIITEDGAFIITENGVDMLAFEPASNTPQTFTNSDSSFSVTVNGYICNFSWNAISNAVNYEVTVSATNIPGTSNIGFNTTSLSKNLDTTTAFSPSSINVYAFLRPQFANGSYGSYIPTLTLYVHN